MSDSQDGARVINLGSAHRGNWYPRRSTASRVSCLGRKVRNPTRMARAAGEFGACSPGLARVDEVIATVARGQIDSAQNSEVTRSQSPRVAMLALDAERGGANR